MVKKVQFFEFFLKKFLLIFRLNNHKDNLNQIVNRNFLSVGIIQLFITLLRSQILLLLGSGFFIFRPATNRLLRFYTFSGIRSAKNKKGWQFCKTPALPCSSPSLNIQAKYQKKLIVMTFTKSTAATDYSDSICTIEELTCL